MDDDQREDKNQSKEDPPQERMEIEDEPSKNEENKFNEFFPNIFGNPMEIESCINNFRLNKFCPQSHFLPLSQNKAHAGLPSEINKLYYKKTINPRFNVFISFS